MFTQAKGRVWRQDHCGRDCQGLPSKWVIGVCVLAGQGLAAGLKVSWEGKTKSAHFLKEGKVWCSVPRILSPRGREGPTINFIGHQDARDLRPELPKFCIPGTQVLIGDFPLDVKYLQRVGRRQFRCVKVLCQFHTTHTQTGVYKLRPAPLEQSQRETNGHASQVEVSPRQKRGQVQIQMPEQD